jgi:hypothetical protein
MFFDLEEIIFENYFNISENNMISVELAKVTTKAFLRAIPHKLITLCRE